MVCREKIPFSFHTRTAITNMVPHTPVYRLPARRTLKFISDKEGILFKACSATHPIKAGFVPYRNKTRVSSLNGVITVSCRPKCEREAG